ncbi:MAG: hypothetical protein ABL951_14500 [Alphaproteobacteria bacterium]
MSKTFLDSARQAIGTLLRWVYRAYRITAMTVGTLLMLVWSFALLKYFTERATLPNGYQLAPTNFDPDDIQILDRDGTQVATNVDMVMWCNDAIYGYRKEVVDHHPRIFPGVVPNGKIGVTYMFIYDRGTKVLQQFETVIHYNVGIQNDSMGQPDSKEEFKFDRELERRNLPALEYDKMVRYLDIIHGLDIVPKDELCRTSNSREDKRPDIKNYRAD